MLDKKMLDDMPAGCIFATGTAIDDPDGLFMARTGKELRWLAKRGDGISDWAIYCHFSENDLEWIKRHGDKVCDKKHIQKLVPCDKESFNRYRY